MTQITERLSQSPKINIIADELIEEQETFLVDTGAELSVVHKNKLKPKIDLDSRMKFILYGIGGKSATTLGEVSLNINGSVCSFQVIPDGLSIPVDGIVGMPFLKHGSINLKQKIIDHPLGVFPFSLENKNRRIELKPRIKELITLAVQNLEIGEGYLPRLDLGPGIYLGETLVRVKEGVVKLYCTNATATNVELIILFVVLEEFETAELKNKKERKQKVKDQDRERMEQLIEILNISDLNTEETVSLVSVISEFPNQFYPPGDRLGCTNAIKHKINLTDNTPIYKKGYRHPPAHKEIIEKDTQELLKNKSIIPSNSPYNSPVWVIPKKADYEGNKKWRVVIDNRALNEKTVGDAYPLPNIIDILDQLGGAKYFSVLDLAKGFHQIEVESKYRYKTAFSTPFGHYEFNRMPLELKNAPATFRRLMDRVLLGLQGNIPTYIHAKVVTKTENS